MNPISVKNRNLNLAVNHPAQPGVLMDHKLCFFGSQGFAEVIYEKGSSLHGVVYQNVPANTMAELDMIERDYIRKLVDVQLYHPISKHNGGDEAPSSTTKTTLKNVSVYCRPQEDIEGSRHVDLPPSERYLQVLIYGARHYGVDPKYIQWLQDHECQPRCDPSDYTSFPVAEGQLGTMKRDAVDTLGNGLDGKPLYLRCNGKVVEFCKESDEDPLFKEWQKMFHKSERDIDLFIARVQYDPMFGCPSCVEEMTEEWSAYTEHLFCEYMKGHNLLQRWKVIAYLVD